MKWPAIAIGVGVPLIALCLMWYKCLPYVTNNVLNNKPLMKILIWMRSVMLIKRNPDSLAATAITMESESL